MLKKKINKPIQKKTILCSNDFFAQDAQIQIFNCTSSPGKASATSAVHSQQKAVVIMQHRLLL